jgi:hypothetical protein
VSDRSPFRVEHLLPIACVGAAALLFASEFMDIFHFNAAPGQTFAVDTAAERHYYALAVLSVFAVIALVVALASGSKPAAAAVAIAGAAALLLFLLLDLPDAGNVGTLSDPRESFFNAKADPATGFWVELAGALLLAICGGALATLKPEQLRRLGDPFRLVPRGAQEDSAEGGRAAGPLQTATEAREDFAASGAESRAGRRTQAERRRERS